MKRPMVMFAVAWLAGILSASRWPELETKYVIVSYFFLIILGLYVLKKYPHSLNPYVQSQWYSYFTMCLILLPCLFLAGHWRMEQEVVTQKNRELPWKQEAEAGETHVTVQGIVKEKHSEKRVELVLTDCSILEETTEEKLTAGNCLIVVEEEGKEWLTDTAVGNRIQVYGKFFLYEEAGNPGQFDAWEYYTGKGLYASVKALRITVLSEECNSLGQTVFVLKQRMRESVSSLYAPEKAGVLAAMLLGDKDLLSEDIETLYRQNGISHILAISGLHISMLCMGLFEGLRSVGLSLKLRMLISVGFLGFFIVFTGAGTSSLRAGVMCLVVFGAKLFRRSYDLLSSLALAAMVVTALRPMELASASFLLSFGAVLGVALAQETEALLKEEWAGKRSWWSVLLFGGMIQLVTMPISLWFFYELSPFSILLNLLVIPLVSLILGGGLLSVVLGMVWPGIAKLAVGGTDLLLEFYECLGTVIQKLPFSFVLVGRPAVWQLVLYYALLPVSFSLFFVWMKKHLKQRRIPEKEPASKKKRRISIEHPVCRLAIGITVTVCVLFLPKKNQEQLLFLDVSQGDSLLITTEQGAVILSDCGSSDVAKVGEYRLCPVLKQSGTILIDKAVVSHMDSDHTSGIKELLEAMPVYRGRISYMAYYDGTIGIAELILPKVKEKSEAYLELEALALEKNVAIRYVQQGDIVHQETGMLIECVSPKEAVQSENDTSLVLCLQTPWILAWLMGDAGVTPEKQLMARLESVNLAAVREGKEVLLKVGHHGSHTSSGSEFLAFIQPDIAVISCGYQNSYGHPHEEVLNCLDATKTRVFRTDLQGAVKVTLGRNREAVVQTWLKKQRR